MIDRRDERGLILFFCCGGDFYALKVELTAARMRQNSLIIALQKGKAKECKYVEDKVIKHPNTGRGGKE